MQLLLIVTWLLFFVVCDLKSGQMTTVACVFASVLLYSYS